MDNIVTSSGRAGMTAPREPPHIDAGSMRIIGPQERLDALTSHDRNRLTWLSRGNHNQRREARDECRVLGVYGYWPGASKMNRAAWRKSTNASR